MSNILSEINRVREIMGLIKEQVSFRDNPNIDTTRVDKFSIQGSTGEGTANILKNGEVIEVEVMGGLATVTGVRAVGNELIVDVEAPFGQGGAKTMGKFVIDEITEDYKFEPNNEIYGQLKGDDKADFDAFVEAIEDDPGFATQVIASVEGITDFNPSEYGIEIATTESGEDIVVSEEYPLIKLDDRDTFTGKGTMIWSNAQQQGDFNAGKLNGQGKEIQTMIDEDEWIVKNQGEFKDGLLDGQGTVTYPDGQRYVGEFKGGSFDGQGTMTYADGKIEKGLWGEGDYIQGTTTFADGTEEKKFSKEEIEAFSWPSNISQEIQEWAKEEISFRMSMLQDGVTSTMDEEGLEEYREQITRLQEEPVSVAREEKEWYCKQFEDGATETYINYEEECLTYTKLLQTQGADETVDVNKVVTTPTGVPSCAEQNLCDDPDNAGECIECEVASELPLKGCTDPNYEEYDEKYVIDDGSCKTFAKTIGDLKSELKSQWQKEVKTQLDIVGKGDIYGFQEAYMLQNENKLEAVLVMLNNLLCVSAHVAKALLLTQNRTMEYSPEKLIIAADSPGTGEGHIDLVAGIKRNLKLIDRSFKWWKNKKLGKAIDAKIEPIKTQLNRASDFIDALTPYINWDEEITFSDGSSHRAISTHDILANSKNKRQTIVNCAEQ